MSDHPPVGSTLGRYRLVGVLGHGGTGIVYAAVDEDLDRDVALKVLSPDLAGLPGFRRRFAREAVILSGLRSPHVIDVYDHGEHEGWSYIASPLIGGGDLRRHLRDHGPLSIEEGLDVAEQVCEALADAHRAGVVHRDVKPGNVLLHLSPHGGCFAYLGDFGIAQSPGDERTPTESLTGTTAYLAPERHTGAAASAAGDVYSLGCLLATVLTGRPPYQGTDAQVAAQHLHAPVPRLEADDPVARAVNAVLRRSMAKNPDDRYPSAVEMHEDLKQARQLARAPTSAQDGAGVATTGRRRARTPWGGRRGRPTWVAAGASTVLVVLSFGVAGGYTWTQERSQRCETTSDSGEPCPPAEGRTAERTAPYTCWDGTPVRRRWRCTGPAALRGMLWTFPSLEGDLDGCRRRVDLTVDPSLGSWTCPTSDGDDALVRYTEWLSSETAAARYRRRFDERAVNFVVGGAPAGYQWRSSRPDEDGYVRLTVAYLRWPFSATLRARTQAGLDRLCDTVVGRSPGTFEAAQVDCGPAADDTAPGPRIPRVDG